MNAAARTNRSINKSRGSCTMAISGSIAFANQIKTPSHLFERPCSIQPVPVPLGIMKIKDPPNPREMDELNANRQTHHQSEPMRRGKYIIGRREQGSEQKSRRRAEKKTNKRADRHRICSGCMIDEGETERGCVEPSYQGSDYRAAV